MRLADARVFVCLQDWITAKVGQFHWNLVLWIGPTSRKHLKLLVVARSWIWIPVTFFLFHHCRIRHFTKIYQHNFSHSHGRLSRNSARWSTGVVSKGMNPQHFDSDPAGGHPNPHPYPDKSGNPDSNPGLLLVEVRWNDWALAEVCCFRLRLVLFTARLVKNGFLQQQPATISCAARAFCAAAPTVWNSLGVHTRSADTFLT